MKLKDFLTNYSLTSNATVILKIVGEEKEVKLEKHQIEQLKPRNLMDTKILSIRVVDNIITIHISKGSGAKYV